MSDGVLRSFLAALQASLSVLLTISYGAVASRFNLLKESSSRDISKTCVRLFLPALMITNVGSELRAETASRYLPVLIWALVYTISSIGLGWLLKRLFKFPAWTIPAICFNNTTALPLLLIQSLETSGCLKDLTMGPEDSSSAALSRAKSYFLVSAMVGNCLTFALGPKLLDDEESPDKSVNEPNESKARRQTNGHVENDEERANPVNDEGRTAEEEEEQENESTTLLPQSIAHRVSRAQNAAEEIEQRNWNKLPPLAQKILSFLGEFLNAPLIGAAIGALLGLVSPLHKVFFNEPSEGGLFKAWLTNSVKNVGDLFATLQLLVVGAKLSTSLLKMKKGESSGEVKLVPVMTIFAIRFLMWPCISIASIYFITAKTNLLGEDPVLWFVLMLMPTGPSATKLIALADVSGADEDEKMSIAKFITISYAFSPVICLAVVGSLKATLALIG